MICTQFVILDEITHLSIHDQKNEGHDNCKIPKIVLELSEFCTQLATLYTLSSWSTNKGVGEFVTAVIGLPRYRSLSVCAVASYFRYLPCFVYYKR
jgi:L-asparaginase II